MAIRLEKAVIRGELSNEIRGQVTGRLWLLGRKDPLTFKLLGDCLRDLAGCVLSFENPNPEPLPHLDLLAAIQQGPVGDMTASRKARVPTVSESDLLDLLAKGKSIPAKLSNILYLEWFSDTNGRVVIEAPDFNVSLSEAFWKMDRQDGTAQELANQHAFHDYIDSITGMDPSDDDEDDEEDLADDEDEDSFANSTDPRTSSPHFASSSQDAFDSPLNEFEWEQELREVDRRAEAYAEACDRYHNHPQRERLIAEAMGWEPEDIEEMSRHLASVSDEIDFIDPATSQISPEDPDEIAAQHPLSRRAVTFALGLQRDAESAGLLARDCNRESPVVSVIVSVIALGGKLAAALDPLVEGFDLDPGFVIAMLKRALVPLNEALHALASIDTRPLKRPARAWIRLARRELFSLRADVLDLMQQLRAAS